jgi:hypothetical protein
VCPDVREMDNRNVPRTYSISSSTGGLCPRVGKEALCGRVRKYLMG